MNTFFEISIGGRPAGRLEFELFDKVVPKTAENFRSLCIGGKRSAEGTKLEYKRSRIHRLIPGFMAQGGDFTKNDGTGGLSIYGPTFEDENFALKHDKRGLLSMANAGPNTNASQFFITFAPTPHLDGRHVVFGRVCSGFDVLKEIELVPTGGQDAPSAKIEIISCGGVSAKTNDHAPTALMSESNSDSISATSSAVNAKLSKFKSAQKRRAQIIAKKSVEMNFPVPTDTNPGAIFRDEEGITLAKAKLDGAQNAESSANEVSMNPRKRKLLELRKKMIQGRQSNQKEVVQEHRRFLDKGLLRRQRQREWEQMENENLEELKAKGGSEKDAHLTETAEKAVASEEKARKKATRAAKSMDRSGLYNQEAAYQAYKKRINSAPEADLTTINTSSVQSGEERIAPELVNRMVAELDATDKRKKLNKIKSKGKKIEGKDVDGINDSNDAWNNRLSRAFDKYTVEIRQNLERGTAL